MARIRIRQKSVVTTIDSFHNALNCMNRRLENNFLLNRNENVLEYSRTKEAQNLSLHGCYSNQNGQKQTKLDRNDINQFPRLPKQLKSNAGKPFPYFATQKTTGQ